MNGSNIAVVILFICLVPLVFQVVKLRIETRQKIEAINDRINAIESLMNGREKR